MFHMLCSSGGMKEPSMCVCVCVYCCGLHLGVFMW